MRQALKKFKRRTDGALPESETGQRIKTPFKKISEGAAGDWITGAQTSHGYLLPV